MGDQGVTLEDRAQDVDRGRRPGRGSADAMLPHAVVVCKPARQTGWLCRCTQNVSTFHNTNAAQGGHSNQK